MQEDLNLPEKKNEDRSRTPLSLPFFCQFALADRLCSHAPSSSLDTINQSIAAHDGEVQEAERGDPSRRAQRPAVASERRDDGGVQRASALLGDG